MAFAARKLKQNLVGRRLCGVITWLSAENTSHRPIRYDSAGPDVLARPRPNVEADPAWFFERSARLTIPSADPHFVSFREAGLFV
jgi:hypothetical protein